MWAPSAFFSGIARNLENLSFSSTVISMMTQIFWSIIVIDTTIDFDSWHYLFYSMFLCSILPDDEPRPPKIMKYVRCEES